MFTTVCCLCTCTLAAACLVLQDCEARVCDQLTSLHNTMANRRAAWVSVAEQQSLSRRRETTD